jgi:hypothetical protein
MSGIGPSDTSRNIGDESAIRSEAEVTRTSNFIRKDPKRKYRLAKFGGLFLSSSGLIRCNSIRDTVQAEHKHIPRQHNDHHPSDSEP